VNRHPSRQRLGATPRRRPRPAWLAVAAAALVVAAALVAQPWRGPGPTLRPAGPETAVVVSDSAGIGARPARTQAGVPLGWPHSRQGAVGAAAGYARVLSTVWFLADAERRHQAVTAMAAPEVRLGLQHAQDEIAAGVARGPFGAGLVRPGVRSLLRTSLLGYRVDHYAPRDAQVALWAVVVYGNDGGLAPQALYATSTLRLRWAGDWKLLEAATVPGPVPVQGQATPSPAGDVVDTAQGFKEFTYVPAA
jgi:hypothetical protein